MGGFEQHAWTPTKRRGPIAAEHSSPGPACVQLPNLLGMTHQTKSLTIIYVLVCYLIDFLVTEIDLIETN